MAYDDNLFKIYEKLESDLVINNQTAFFKAIPDHFVNVSQSSVPQYCGFCQVFIPKRIDEHLRCQPCPGADRSDIERKAAHLMAKTHWKFVCKSLAEELIDLDKLSKEAETESPWKIVQTLVDALKARSVPMKGEWKQPVSIDTVMQDVNVPPSNPIQNEDSVPAQLEFNESSSSALDTNSDLDINIETGEVNHVMSFKSNQDQDELTPIWNMDNSVTLTVNQIPTSSSTANDTKIDFSVNSMDSDSINFQSQDWLSNQGLFNYEIKPSTSINDNVRNNDIIIASSSYNQNTRNLSNTQESYSIHNDGFLNSLSISSTSVSFYNSNKQTLETTRGGTSDQLYAVEPVANTSGTCNFDPIQPIFLEAINTLLDNMESYPDYVIGEIKEIKRRIVSPTETKVISICPYNGLPLQLRINPVNQPLFQRYIDFMNQQGTDENKKKTCPNYVTYITKFMLCAMRLRNRFGQMVTINDFIFAYDVLHYFFKKLRDHKVNFNTQKMFKNAISSFTDFISSIPVWNEGLRGRTLQAIKTTLQNVGKVARKQDKKDRRYKKKKNEQDECPYSLMVAVVDDSRVRQVVDAIKLKDFADVTRADFNFFIGYMMNTWLIRNGMRNEGLYKTLYKDVYPIEDMIYQKEMAVGDQMELFWVLEYDEPKECHYNTDRDHLPGGHIVLNPQMIHDFKWFLGFRKRIVKVINENSTILVNFDGANIKSPEYFMQSFFKSINLADTYRIKCNTIRKASTKAVYGVNMRAAIKNSDMIVTSITSGHDIITKRDKYAEDKSYDSILGHVTYRRIAQQETPKHHQVIEHMKRLLDIKLHTFHSTELNEESEDDTLSEISNYSTDDDSDLNTSKRHGDMINNPGPVKIHASENVEPIVNSCNLIMSQANQSSFKRTISPDLHYDEITDRQNEFQDIDDEECEELFAHVTPLTNSNLNEITRIIKKANEQAVTAVSVKYSLHNQKSALKFVAASRAKPIQCYPHLAIHGCSSVSGHGVYAKKVFQTNDFLFDYRGEMKSLIQHEQDLLQYNQSQQELIKGYRMEVVELGEITVPVDFEAYPLSLQPEVTSSFTSISLSQTLRNGDSLSAIYTPMDSLIDMAPLMETTMNCIVIGEHYISIDSPLDLLTSLPLVLEYFQKDFMSFKAHIQKKHPEMVMNTWRETVKKNLVKYKCGKCDFWHYMKMLETHYKEKHTGGGGHDIFKCPHCPLELLSSAERTRHSKTHLDADGNINYNCNECTLKFQDPAEYAAHYKEHYAQLQYGCAYCPRRFMVPNLCIDHEQGRHAADIAALKSVVPNSLTYFERRNIELRGWQDMLVAGPERNEDGELAYVCKYCEFKCYGSPKFVRHLQKHEKSNCHICNKFVSGSLSSHMKRHESYEQSGLTFKCIDCEQVFNDKICWLAHRAQEHPESVGKYECNVCGETFKMESQVNMHYQTKHVDYEDRAIKCDLCSRMFNRESDLKDHLEKHKTRIYDEPKKCYYCDQKLEDYYMFKEHIHNNHKEHIQSIERKDASKNFFTYKCGECDYRSGLYRIETHYIQKHKAGGFKVQEMWKCRYCPVEFHERGERDQHSTTHLDAQGNIQFNCKECSITYQTAEEYAIHYQEHYEKRPYKCAFCPRRMPNATLCAHHEYTRHLGEISAIKQDLSDGLSYEERRVIELRGWQDMLVAGPQRDKDNKLAYYCKICDEKCYGTKPFSTHMDKHAYRDKKNTKFICEICGTSSATRTGIALHKKVHDKKKLCKCKKCGKQFEDEFTYDLHYKTEHDHRFKCKICKIGYHSEQKLAEHEKAEHYENLPLKCSKCTERFRMIIQLKAHNRLHLPKPMQCLDCKTVLPDAYSFAEHIKTHEGYKQYECPTCGVRVRIKSGLKKLMKAMHDVDFNQEMLENGSCIDSYMKPTRNNKRKCSEDENKNTNPKIQKSSPKCEMYNPDDNFFNDQQPSTAKTFSPLPISVAVLNELLRNENSCCIAWTKRAETDLLCLAALYPKRCYICVIEDGRKRFSYNKDIPMVSGSISSTNAVPINFSVYSCQISQINSFNFDSYKTFENFLKEISGKTKVVNFRREEDKHLDATGIQSQIISCNSVVANKEGRI